MKAKNTQMVDCSPYAGAYIHTHTYIYINAYKHACIHA